ncbi:MAG: DNA polymerase III subunit alpha, partial [Gammaproteobacteria bacterium]|nr:DNA polymerase III subunit alpha [Gammaproteobacteria bacterium]
MTPSFVHLRLHTEFSLVDSVVRVDELVAAAAAAGMPAVGVSDQYNLFAMVKFYRAALAHGVQPVIGVDLHIREPSDPQGPSQLTLFCQNLKGYRNLTRLVSRAWLEGQVKGRPLLERAWLDAGTTEGLLALSGAQHGDVGRGLVQGRAAQAGAALDAWLALFGDRYYLEVQRIGAPGEEAYVGAALALAAARGVPPVATNDVRFIAAADFEAHEARVCIHEGTLLADPARPRRYTPQQYLRTQQEMQALFPEAPAALANSVEIARRCSLSLRLGEARLPVFPVPASTTPEQYLRDSASIGLAARLAAAPPAGGADERYHKRLAAELDVIGPMGFASYFLIVADFIDWARNNGVPVGPGRGSGAGSLVAYALGITDIDPLRYDLLFERFLNPERVSMPDFDIDFCMVGRDRVIDYVAAKYGPERVSQIITYGTLAAKAVVRDVGRVLGHPYGMVDRIAKLVPFELEMTLDKALEKEPELRRLYREDEEVRVLIDMARSLEGLTRNAGKHAGGVVIAPSVLTDFAPLYCEEGGANVVTQFDKDDVEAAGLVKFDFLGLRTLTVLDWAVRDINAARAAGGEPPLELTRLPMDDAATVALLKSCRTTAVFQLESRGMKDLIRRLQPDCFEDIIALVALFRPGPLQSGMVEDFIARKHSRNDQPIDYLHPQLEPILAQTYGVILYQEQVMQIAQVLAGYTLGGADLLRRAMGKKKPEEMAKQRSVFIDGAVARQVPRARAEHIFDLMEKFAGYGFNKSHSAAYAMLAWQTAYLKAHYPAAFMAAVLSADMDRTDKVVTLIDDCALIGLSVLPPDVNASGHAFAVADASTIRYGLGAVKGVGRTAVDALVEERAAGGAYSSLEDLCHRVDLQRVNRRVLEALIRSGSCDSLGRNRAALMERLAVAMQAGEQTARTAEAGQDDLFGLRRPAAADMARPVAAEAVWSEAQRLAGERETLGLYLTGHPIARFERDLAQLVGVRIRDLAGEARPAGGEGERWGETRKTVAAGLILEVRRRGPRVNFVLDDRSGRIEVALSEETHLRCRELVARDELVLVEGSLRFDEFSDAWRIQARNIQSLAAVRERAARRILVEWP